MNRDHKITIRFSDSEYKSLKEKAGATPLATYIRGCVTVTEAVTVTKTPTVTVTKDRVTVTKPTPEMVGPPVENLTGSINALQPSGSGPSKGIQTDGFGNRYRVLTNGNRLSLPQV